MYITELYSHTSTTSANNYDEFKEKVKKATLTPDGQDTDVVFRSARVFCTHGSGIKIRYGQPSFYWISEYTVKCVLPAEFILPDEFMAYADEFTKAGVHFSGRENYGFTGAITACAFASCTKEDRDRFSVEIGEKIALNKAKIKMHDLMTRASDRIMSRMHFGIAKLISFVDSEERLKEKNANYIESLIPAQNDGEQQEGGETPETACKPHCGMCDSSCDGYCPDCGQ